MRTMWESMDRRACRCMLLRLMARKAIAMRRRAGRQRCDLQMEERGRRECAGTRLLQRPGRVELKERAECRGVRLRITVVAGAVLRHPAVPHQTHLREARERAVALAERVRSNGCG